jgi:hypothetical protein
MASTQCGSPRSLSGFLGCTGSCSKPIALTCYSSPPRHSAKGSSATPRSPAPLCIHYRGACNNGLCYLQARALARARVILNAVARIAMAVSLTPPMLYRREDHHGDFVRAG